MGMATKPYGVWESTPDQTLSNPDPYLLQIVLRLVMLIGSLAELLLQVDMPVVDLLLRHLSILCSQSALHLSNDALPVTARMWSEV